MERFNICQLFKKYAPLTESRSSRCRELKKRKRIHPLEFCWNPVEFIHVLSLSKTMYSLGGEKSVMMKASASPGFNGCETFSSSSHGWHLLTFSDTLARQTREHLRGWVLLLTRGVVFIQAFRDTRWPESHCFLSCRVSLRLPGAQRAGWEQESGHCRRSSDFLLERQQD